MCESLVWRKEPTGPGWWWYRFRKTPWYSQPPIELHAERLHSNAPPIPLWFHDQAHGRYAPGVTLASQLEAEWAGPIQQPPRWQNHEPEAV
jgi:hypothetical protein